MAETNRIVEIFNESFQRWEIRLPDDALISRQVGRIVKGGWAIWYLSGADATGEYLDYYASHRMTDDRHIRIRTDGTREQLETIRGMFVIPKDASPEEIERLRQEHRARNRAIDQRLKEKGFTLSGQEPGSVLINRHLLTNPGGEK